MEERLSRKRAIEKLAAAMDGKPLPSNEIGAVRRALFVDRDSRWNSHVRDLTASYETESDNDNDLDAA